MKTAFVTGAGRGLGEAFLEVLQQDGFYVFAGVKKNKLKKKTLSLEYVECDIASDESIKKVRKYIGSKTTILDLLINNAGINKDTATDNHKELVNNLDSLSREHLLKMLDVNAVSSLMMVKYFLGLFKNDPSFIINISSCRASYSDEFEDKSPNYGYSASKAALNMYTWRLTKELPKNIKIFAVHPGDMKTDMNPDGSQKPDLQARRILKLIGDWKDENNGRFMRWSGERYPL